MLRKILFQTHWFLGITAGVVLALVGVTGALLSYEDALLKVLNPGVMTVEAGGRAPLPPSELLARVSATEPGNWSMTACSAWMSAWYWSATAFWNASAASGDWLLVAS